MAKPLKSKGAAEKALPSKSEDVAENKLPHESVDIAENAIILPHRINLAWAIFATSIYCFGGGMYAVFHGKEGFGYFVFATGVFLLLWATMVMCNWLTMTDFKSAWKSFCSIKGKK